MKRFFQIAFIILIFNRCEKVITPDIKAVDPSIVVDGMISTDPSLNKIFITYSRTFGSNNYTTGVLGLTVYVLDNYENRIIYTDISNNGTYASEINQESTAKVGNTYTLYIESPDGLIYKSSPQTVKECPKISSLYINYETQSVLTEDAYGAPVEMIYPGFSIFNDTKGILAEGNYYLYRWYGYEEHRATISPIPANGSLPDIYRHQPISGNLIRVLCTGNADEYSDKQLRKNKFVFIPKFTFMDYQPIFPDTFTLAANHFDGIIFASQQYSISKEVYNFWKEARAQLDADGKIFDPVSEQLVGNIACVNDPAKSAFGTFYATDVKYRYDYLYINYKNKTYSEQIDSIPELWIDTCSWNVPAGWIFPPI
jgi:hypothetical protein